MNAFPEKYKSLTNHEIIKRVDEVKKKYGSELVILGHHYEHDTIITLADLKGDSFALAKMASEQDNAKHIVFCGVYFMAEAAAVLSKPNQNVYIPVKDAGCPLADFAEISHISKAWEEMGGYLDTDKIIPACYMNSSADTKAFCGEHGGIVCTSSNAVKIFQWALEKGDKLFFMPDEQLGKNTAAKLGIAKVITWDSDLENGGNSPGQIKDAKIVVWKGYCHVHASNFTLNDVKELRAKYPDVKIIVHPECTPEIVNAADENGSTAEIINYVKNAPHGSVIGVGTEFNMVNRLINDYRGVKKVIPLKQSYCPDMGKITPANLLYCLENLESGNFTVTVNKNVSANAKIALERMLKVTV